MQSKIMVNTQSQEIMTDWIEYAGHTHAFYDSSQPDPLYDEVGKVYPRRW